MYSLQQGSSTSSLVAQSSKTAKADDAEPPKTLAQDSVIGKSKLGSLHIQKEEKETPSLERRRTQFYRDERNCWDHLYRKTTPFTH